LELIAAAGLQDAGELRRKHINRRVNSTTVLRYDEIFNETEIGSLL